MNRNLQKTAAWLIPSLVLALPVVVSAQNDVESLLGDVRRWLDLLVPILMGIGLIFFIWGLIQYFRAEGSDDDKKAARSNIVYGIIIFAAIVGIWGLVNIVLETLNINPGPSWSRSSASCALSATPSGALDCEYKERPFHYCGWAF
ncbi:MAG: hypothetical protein UY88_C0001G0003 [Parcubacteria group bacterium GW2011_GWA1_54_88]|nr:MAG: hypothetical protein UY88_C0001G0003 [Parcubacteria group bacterium GW2011_GWA1_54_88]